MQAHSDPYQSSPVCSGKVKCERMPPILFPHLTPTHAVWVGSDIF